MLLREGRLDERRRAERDAEFRRAEAQRRVWTHEEEARRSFELAREELATMRSRKRASGHGGGRASGTGPGEVFGPGPSGSEAGGGGGRPDEERKKWKGKEKEKEKEAGDDGCCERLLACIQEEAEFQHYRWSEMRE